MENKKLIKAIKKSVIKQIESDLKKSILKDFYNSASKKEIKKLRKKILREVQEKLFGKTQEDVSGVSNIISDSVADAIDTLTIIREKETEITDETTQDNTEVFSEKESEVALDVPKSYEYKGFKFDTERMSSLVTGRARKKSADKSIVENTEGGVERANPKDVTDRYSKSVGTDYFQPFLPGFINPKDLKSNPERTKNIDDVRSGKHKDMFKKAVGTEGINPSLIPLSLINSFDKLVPQTKNFVKYNDKIAPASKEDLTFFIGKLKDGISKLGKGEKNINYRHASGDIYVFTYDKPTASSKGFLGESIIDKDDFYLNFALELNVKTLEAKVKDFRFSIDGFRFDSSFFDLIDIVKVLDIVGMNISKYAEEINGINISTHKKISATKPSKKPKRNSEDSLDKIISDKRILKILSDNDISNFGQLKEFSNDFTAIKGVGSKTAEKLKMYIKR